MGGRSERCRRLVRHTLRCDIGYPESYRARLTPRSPICGALWRQDYLAKAIGAKDEFAGRVRVTTYKVQSSTLQFAAVSIFFCVRSRHGEGSDAFRSTEPPRLHHAARWRSGCLAARGARSRQRLMLDTAGCTRESACAVLDTDLENSVIPDNAVRPSGAPIF